MPSSLVHTTTSRPLLIPIVVLVMIYIISIIFFHIIEGWNFLDAAYYTTVTLATVGYGDFTPKTSLGKIGAIVLIFAGVSTALYVITHLGVLTEKTIDPYVKKRLDMLRSLTTLQSGEVKKDEMKKIQEKMGYRYKEDKDKAQGFGRL